jgi:hypothetical protein
MGHARALLRLVPLHAALGDHGAGKAVRQNDSLGCCWPARPPASIDGEHNGRRLFRTIELASPVLLIDEADTFLGDNEELRGVLNQGHRMGGQIIRTAGDDYEPRFFNIYAPVAIATIGGRPAPLRIAQST